MVLEIPWVSGKPSAQKLVEPLWFAGFVVAYAAVDISTRAAAGYRSADTGGPSLASDALTATPLAVVGLIALIGVALVHDRRVTLGSWSVLEQGAALRLLVAPLIVLLIWQGALGAYDYHLDQANVIDRLLLVVTGAGALFRPGFLLAFVAQQRILAAPLAFPFGPVPGRNIDELLVIVIAAVAGAHLLVAITRRQDTSPLVALIVAAVATHFFVPGFGKLRDGWLLGEDLRYLAPNANAAGWLGQTDGGLVENLSNLVGAIGLPARLGVLVLELGAVVAAVRHRWFRWWLVPAALFHVVNFVMLGYWFIGWIALEVGLFVLLRRAPREWLDRNLTPARGLATAAIVVVLGTTLFHPPRLRWFDSPVAEGYRIEAIGESGAAYHVPFDALAPFEEDLAFTSLLLGEHRPVTGPYGSVGGAERVEQLQHLHDMADVDELREPLTDEQRLVRDRSEAFLADWLMRANQRAAGEGPAIDRLWSLRAPTWFWTGRAEPNYRFDEPIRELRVERLTSLTTNDQILHGSTTVLILDAEAVALSLDAS